MDLYLIRHAEAQDGGLYGADALRPLTADGRRAARSVGEALHSQKVVFTEVVASPLVRAVETAELIMVGLGYDGALQASEELEPGGTPAQILSQVVAAHWDAQSLALVGHEPSMGALLSVLLQRRGLALGKGTAVRLTLEHPDKPAQLVWTIKPRRLSPSPSLDL